MTTGRKVEITGLEIWEEESLLITVQVAMEAAPEEFKTTSNKVHILTTAELDSMVAAAEARGAELMKQEALNLATFLANGRPRLYVADFLIELSEKAESVTAKAQAHTLRDEARAQGLVDAAEEVESHEWLSRGERDTLKEAILALRRDT